MKIVSAELQSAISIHGTKVLGAISLNQNKYPGIVMTFTQWGLQIIAPTGQAAKPTVTFITPFPNLKGAEVAKEEEPSFIEYKELPTKAKAKAKA